MQNGEKALLRTFLWKSLVTVLHTCVSIMLNVLEPTFVWNLFQNSYAETLNSGTRTLLSILLPN